MRLGWNYRFIYFFRFGFTLRPLRLCGENCIHTLIRRYFPNLEIRRVTSLRLSTEGCSFVPRPGPLGAVM